MSQLSVLVVSHSIHDKGIRGKSITLSSYCSEARQVVASRGDLIHAEKGHLLPSNSPSSVRVPGVAQTLDFGATS